LDWSSATSQRVSPKTWDTLITLGYVEERRDGAANQRLIRLTEKGKRVAEGEGVTECLTNAHLSPLPPPIDRDRPLRRAAHRLHRVQLLELARGEKPFMELPEDDLQALSNLCDARHKAQDALRVEAPSSELGIEPHRKPVAGESRRPVSPHYEFVRWANASLP
jgi:hypothetical protein